MIYDSILDCIGNTPLVRFNRLSAGIDGTIVGKLEYMNPGGSVKDRIGYRMIREAERQGLLKAGGTLIEATSGNTGMGIALAAVSLGYKMIFTMPDKMSQEKINLLKAFGAKVIVTPTSVDADDPRSYYSVAKRLAREIPGAFYPNQFANPENPKAHYDTTGPELWEQTGGRIDYFVAGMGTGGTMAGAGRYLKEKNPDIVNVAADPEGSIYANVIKTGKPGDFHGYKIEGIGEDIIPSTSDLAVVDDVVTVSDKDAFNMTRRLAREEGLFCGGSTGAAVCAALEVGKRMKRGQVLVVILCDTGDRYLSKVHNDAWMQENQYLDESIEQTAFEIIMAKQEGVEGFVSIAPDKSVRDALDLMRRLEISQVPVIEDDRNTGVIEEAQVIDLLIQGANLEEKRVGDVAANPLPEVDLYAHVSEISAHITRGVPGVLVKTTDRTYSIITKFDLLHARR